IKQRQGRLGRTRPGEYYPLYTFTPSKKFPVPQICQTELVQIEFSLQRSPLKCGLEQLKKWLPSPPSDQVIEAAKKRLRDLDVLDRHNHFTSIGSLISTLPDFGSIAMSKAVLSGLETYNCGRDIIRLAAILSVLNTSSVLRHIPSQYIKSEGDFMTLLAVMDAILAEKLVQPPHLFDVDDACKRTGLTVISHHIRRAVIRYDSFQKFFCLPGKYRDVSQRSTKGNWTPIACALLAGYSDNVYLSLAEIQGKKTSLYSLYCCKQDQPLPLVLARDIFVSTDIRDRSIISFLGEIQPEWLDRSLERDITLADKEIKLYNDEIRYSEDFLNISRNILCTLNGKNLNLSGNASHVLTTELHVRRRLVLKHTTLLISKDETNKSLKQNVKALIESLHVFNPMKWRWKAENQVKVIFRDTDEHGEIIIKARDKDYEKVRKEFDSFVQWLEPCIALHLDNGMYPRRYIDPQTKQTEADMESRIKQVTDDTLTSVDLWPSVRGLKATRETRMEVVAWIAVCLFRCKLEGGFVRDWIVANQSARPPASVLPQQWVQFSHKIPVIDKAVIPSDLDCHLPLEHPFDIDQFLDEIHKYHIQTEVFRQDWRYVLLFDRNYPTGPFTMDLIEPHVALTQNRIDFDVNNLYVIRGFCAELGQRVNLRDPPFSIDLEQIVDSIKNKRFRVLRPDDTIVGKRKLKMLERGWQKFGDDLNYIPPPHKNHKFVLDPLPTASDLYKKIENEMKQISNAKVLSIEQIRNTDVFNIYHATKVLITGQCTNGINNERHLFHGTPTDNVESIMEKGFDARYFSSSGLYGRGAYFADKTTKSHQYTRASLTDSNRKMFYCLVTLGEICNRSTTDDSLSSPPEHYHSICGMANPSAVEYIVYQSAQAIPFLLITYQV
ncbi:unnamed protein product, partial [Adineta ricciae]